MARGEEEVKRVMREGLKYLEEIEAIPTIEDVMAVVGSNKDFFKNNRKAFAPLYAKIFQKKREIMRNAYHDLIKQSANGNSQSSEKLIKVFGTTEERKAINGITIEGEIDLGLHDLAVKNFNSLFGIKEDDNDNENDYQEIC